MKNYYLKTAILLLLLLGTAATAGAYDFVQNGIYYNYGSGASTSSTVYVTYKDTNYNSYSGAVSVPRALSYNGKYYIVDWIGPNAFQNCTNLTSVTLPISLTGISAYAFKGCTALTSITIPNNVTSIRGEAFANCTSLKTVIFGSDTQCKLSDIEAKTFDGCTGLGATDANIYCRATTPPTIYSNTFTSATLSNAKLYVPGASLSAYHAADYWKNFSSINAAFDFVVDGIYYHITGTNTVEVTWKTADYNTYSGSITIPSSVSYNGTTYNVTCIGNRAFRQSSGLTNVYLPHSVTKIDQYAFSYCTGLTDIELNEVTYIGNDAFYNTGLTGVAIPSTVTYLGAEAFCNCASLSTVFIPNGITYIRYRTFQKCTSLWSIEIPNTVTTIEHSAFRWCSDLERVVLGSDISCELTSIGNYAFDGCTALGNSDGSGSITCMALTPPTVSENTFGELNVTWGLNTNISAIERYAKLYTPYSAMRTYNSSNSRWQYFVNDQYPRWEFYSAPYYYIISGDNTAYITHYGSTVNDIAVSYNQSNITSRTLPSSVTFNNKTYTVNGIYGAFSGCTALQSVTIPNTYTHIGRSAFDGCTNLSTADLPESVTMIDVFAFRNTALTNIVIPNQVTEVGIGAYAHDGTSPITEVTCLATTPPYVYQEVNKAGQLNTWNGSNVFNNETYTSAPLFVPAGCKSAYQEAYDWKNFSNIYEMGYDFCVNGIYYKITGTNTVEVTYKSLTNGYKSYSGNITIPATVTYNGTTYNVTSIGQDAFYLCSGVTSVSLPNTIKTLNNWCFEGTGITSIGIPSSVTRIGSMVFFGCNNLKSITIPNSVTYIGQRVFYNCTSLELVTVGSGITALGEREFYGCTNLKNLTFMATTPPTLGSTDVFPDAAFSTAMLFVPKASVSAYKAATTWKSFNIIYPTLNYALDANDTGLQFTTTTDYPWTNVSTTGRVYAQSSNAGVHSSTSSMSIEVTAAGEGSISFDFKAWGEGTSTIFDKCQFLIDGVAQFTYGARQNDWETYTATIPAGTHTLTWSYSKDSSVNKDGDYFAVDNVILSLPAYQVGDVNGDGRVTIADVTALIDILLAGDVEYDPRYDINGDGRITIADVTALIDLLLSGGN